MASRVMEDLRRRLQHSAPELVPVVLRVAWEAETITRDDLREVLPGLWHGTAQQMFPSGDWLPLLRAAGFVTNVGFKPYDEAPDEWRREFFIERDRLVIFRAAQRANERGITWTPRLGVAQAYALHWAMYRSWSCVIAEARIDPRRVLGVRRDEDDDLLRWQKGATEILVDPDHLEDVRVIEEAPVLL